jgi:hypothetical protein
MNITAEKAAEKGPVGRGLIYWNTQIRRRRQRAVLMPLFVGCNESGAAQCP